MPRPPLERPGVPSSWTNISNSLGELLDRNADAGVAHPDDYGDRLLAAGRLDLGGEHDAAAFRRVLGRVVEQVHEHLRQAYQVGLENHWMGGKLDRQVVAELFDEWPAALEGTLDDFGQGDPAPAELELAAADAGNIEQVVDQASQMVHLPFDDVEAPLHVAVGRAAQLEDADRVEDRRHGIAQLVGEDGEELILARVALAQALLARLQQRGRGLELKGFRLS